MKVMQCLVARFVTNDDKQRTMASFTPILYKRSDSLVHLFPHFFPSIQVIEVEEFYRVKSNKNSFFRANSVLSSKFKLIHPIYTNLQRPRIKNKNLLYIFFITEIIGKVPTRQKSKKLLGFG